MTDVRLTALNPTDSQVYPVACNTSGELIVAGDGTDYLPLTGGDLTGDLTFNTDKITLDATDGGASFGGGVTQIFSSYGILLDSPIGASSNSVIAINNDGTRVINLNADGSGTFSGAITVTENINGLKAISGSGTGSGPVLRVYSDTLSTYTTDLNADGSAILKGGITILSPSPGSSSIQAFGVYGLGAASAAVSIKTDGSAQFLGTVTATVVPPSDARFKENIEPAKPQLPDVVALGGILKNYNWNSEAPVNDEIRAQRQLGLIAQEAAKICPSLVKELGSEENIYKGIPMEALIMKLIGAVSELKTELDQMKIT